MTLTLKSLATKLSPLFLLMMLWGSMSKVGNYLPPQYQFTPQVSAATYSCQQVQGYSIYDQEFVHQNGIAVPLDEINVLTYEQCSRLGIIALSSCTEVCRTNGNPCSCPVNCAQDWANDGQICGNLGGGNIGTPGCREELINNDGNPGDVCCVGGTQTCQSGACSAGIWENPDAPAGQEFNFDGFWGTCLSGGGNNNPGNCDLGFCNYCGGFCLEADMEGGCYGEAYRRRTELEPSDPNYCTEIITYGSCAKSGYNSITHVCEKYCTNIVSKTDCSADVGRPCSYVTPNDPNYKTECPKGTGYTNLGWDGQCFNGPFPSGADIKSYYCPCPNGDCSQASWGSGCQDNGINYACYQDQDCGVLQVDVDWTTDGGGHESRNKLITSGCGSTPPPSNPPSSNPPSSNPPASNPPASNPPVGPQCIGVTMSKANPVLGDTIDLTCQPVPVPAGYTTVTYGFRIVEPDGTEVSLNPRAAEPNRSLTYTVSQAGEHVVQCTICPDGVCLDFEPVN